MVLVVVNLLTGVLELRGDLHPAWVYAGPHPQSHLQQPPVLSCAQLATYDENDERTLEAVLLATHYLANADVFPQILVSRDSGVTWEVLAEDGRSIYGAWYQPNALRVNYTYGAAAVAVPIEEL
jgi:hypothetical protein